MNSVVSTVGLTVADISEDGSLCAVASNGHLNVYNTLQNKLICSFKHGNTTIKILKISPSKKVISWLQTNPNHVFLSYIDLKTTKIINTSFSDFTNEFILWSPDGNYLATFSSLSMFIDISQVEDDNSNIVATISGAKSNNHGCPIAQYSYDGELFSTVNVCSQGHSITVYTTENASWDCIKRIFTNECDDLGGLLWCRDSASVLVWQAQRELRLQLWTVYGRQEQQFVEKSAQVTCICLSHCGRLAAMLTADEKVRIIDLLTWQPGTMGVMVHCPIIHKLSSRSAVREPINNSGQITVCEPIPATFYELKHVAPKTGCEPLMQFSPGAQYLVTYEPHYPHTLWIWNLDSNPLLDTVVVLSDETQVSGLLWHSQKTCLAASLTRDRVLVWTPQQSTIVTQTNHLWPFTAETYFASIPVYN